MRKTDNAYINVSDKLSVNTKELQSMLSCGRATALQIGTDANARVNVGKRVLWNVEKIQTYLNTISV